MRRNIVRPPRNVQELPRWRSWVNNILSGVEYATNIVSGLAKFGDVVGGNYTEFESDGSMTAVGDATCYLDEFSQLIGQRLESPSSRIIQSASEGAVYFKDTTVLGTDYIGMTIQFNHDWDYSAIYPHLHWWQASANVPNWILQYRWQVNGSAKSTSWTNVAVASHAFTYSSGTLNQISAFGSIDAPSGAGVSTMLQMRITRDTTNASGLFAGADPLTGDVYGVFFDVHKQVNRLGSRQQYVN